MKDNIIICTIISLLFLSVSCNKEKIKIDEYWGEASANKNGVHWVSLPSAGISNIDESLFISLNTYNEKGYHRELLHLFKLPLNVGEYKVEKTEVRDADGKIGGKYFTSVDDGDVTGDIFYVSDSDSLSKVSITKIEGKEVWGTFNLTLFRDTTRTVQHLGFPDTLVFSGGKFHTKIIK